MPFQLVDDVLMEILDSAYQNDQHLPDYQLLRTFSLVSKAWGHEAQKRLFGEVYLPRRKHSQLFARSIHPSQPRGTYLGSLVLKLRIALSKNKGVRQSDFREIWRSLPFLDTLEVTLPYDGLANHINNFQSLSRTSVRVYKQMTPYREDDLFKLIPKLAPRLEFLSLPRCALSEYLYTTSGGQAVELAGGPPGFSLYELSFSGPFTWLQWVLSSTTNTLTILDLRDSLRDDHFETILSAHGATLLSLRLSNAKQPLTDRASVSLSHCTCLQEFRYLHPPSEATLNHLPTSTLEHLELTLDQRTIRDKEIQFISLASWIEKSNLFVFTWNWEDAPKRRVWRAIDLIVEVCSNSGIELRCFDPPLGTWTGESGSATYPEKSLNTLSFSLARVTLRTNARNRGHKYKAPQPPGHPAGCDRVVNYYREFRESLFEHDFKV